MNYNKRQSIFTNPENFILRLYNTETENQRGISFNLLESFLLFKKTGLLIIKEECLEEFTQDNETNTELLENTYVETNNGQIVKYGTEIPLNSSATNMADLQSSTIMLRDKDNSNIYELFIKDGVIEVNTLN